MTTTNGSFTTMTRIIQNAGEMNLSRTFVDDDIPMVSFTRHCQTISDKRLMALMVHGTGGEIKASWMTCQILNRYPGVTVDASDATNITMPENQTLCLKDDMTTYQLRAVEK